MMTDRELLVLAAKAAGTEVWTDCDGNLYTGDPERNWNPLTDDGDALRLAVKLAGNFPCFMLGIFSCSEFPHVGASIVHRDGAETYVEQDLGDDINAATRRAIVRAAANIGSRL